LHKISTKKAQKPSMIVIIFFKKLILIYENIN